MARHSRHISDPAPTAAQLKGAIDSGETRDKVDHPDLAASPLGTDAEAAAAPPGPQETTQAIAEEVRPSRPPDTPDPESQWAFAFFLGFFIVCFGAMGLVFAVL